MITVDTVSMRYPIPLRYRDILLGRWGKQDVTALENANLTVAPGECVAFLGPNGAGKTTLLKLIGGLLYPSKGCITVCGYDTVADATRVRGKVGFVLNEERSFYWRLTGFQNLTFFAALHNLFGRECRQRVSTVLDVVGLDNAANMRVSDYSCGMRQRLAIARGLLSEPDILILDEPTKAVDPLGAAQIRKLISEELNQARQTTVLISSHHLEEVEAMCDRVCILSMGHIVSDCTLSEILDNSDNIATYYRNTVQG